MLKQLVSAASRKLAALSPDRDRAAMRAQIQRARPDVFHDRGLPAETIDALQDAVAEAAVKHVQRGAVLAEALVRTIHSNAPLQQQVSVAGILVYFVQPNDLIPDSTPGGYGFIDDVILLRCGYEETFHRPPDGDPLSNADAIGFLSSLVAPAVLGQLDQTVKGLHGLIRMLGNMNPFALQMTLEQMIASPLGVPAVTAAPPGFGAPATPTGLPRGRFNGGFYIEGNNISVPGGPALIDGKLYIPH